MAGFTSGRMRQQRPHFAPSARNGRTASSPPCFSAAWLVEGVFAMMGPGAIALGLITAGAGLSFRYAAARPVLIVTVSAIKLLILPVAMFYVCGWLGGDRTAQGIALLAGAAPGAAASYVLARQMGGDAPLMAGVVAFTTVASAATIPLLLAAFRFL